MRNKKEAKNEYITRKDLEEQTQIIIGAVDTILNKRLGKVNTRFDGVDKRFNGVDKRISEMESRLEKKIDGIQTSIDGYVKTQEDFRQEFVIVKEEVRITKNVIKEKLGVEVRAI